MNRHTEDAAKLELALPLPRVLASETPASERGMRIPAPRPALELVCRAGGAKQRGANARASSVDFDAAMSDLPHWRPQRARGNHVDLRHPDDIVRRVPEGDSILLRKGGYPGAEVRVQPVGRRSPRDLFKVWVIRAVRGPAGL